MDQNKKTGEHTFEIIVVIFLAVIVCFELIHLMKVHEISTNTRLTNLAIYGGDASMALRRETEMLKHETERIKHEMNKKQMVSKQTNKEPVLKNEDYDEKNKAYVLEIKVPNNWTKDDLFIQLKKNVLGVGFAGVIEAENGDEQVSDMFSAYRFFAIPETKAKFSDIKYNINNGILTVVIPIIK